MRRAGGRSRDARALRAAIRPGVTTADLDRIGRTVLERRGATSNFLGYHGYPGGDLRVRNDEVIVHGIPGERVLEEGDIVSIDCGAIVDGWHGDAAFTCRGRLDRREAQRLIEVDGGGPRRRDRRDSTRRPAGRHRRRRADRRRGRGSGVVGTTAVTASAGPCTRGPTSRTSARPGGARLTRRGAGRRADGDARGPRVETLDDGWSVVTADGSRAAHVEHTIAVTDDGPEILTLP